MNTPLSFFMSFCAACLSTIDSGQTLSGQLDPFSDSSTAIASSTKTNIMTDEKLFQQVPLETNKQTVCSPVDPGMDWRGVALRAPSRVILPEKTSPYSEFIIPVCGLYLVDAASTVKNPGPRMLVVTDDISGQTYRGALVKPNPHPTIPAPQWRPPNPSTKIAFGNYFNVNAAAYVTLPIQPARYRVTVEYAGHRSNELIITVAERP